MSSSTSIGRGPAHGSNENHDGDPRNTTMGETTSQDEPPLGSGLIDQAVPEATGGAAIGRARPGIASGPESASDGPSAEASPRGPGAARGKSAREGGRSRKG
jgi:hypothetical protein